MEDDIEDAKEKMQEILDGLAAKTKDYRVALIDYRDFAYRSGDDRDYPAQLRMDFTGDEATIRSSINALDLGNGGDERETVYSALMKAAGLEWRNDAQKIIIVLGDAAPLDPEPDTGYTYDTVIASLYNASIMIDYGNTDDRVLGAPEDSLISVYSIGTDASMAAADFFMDLSEATGGSYTGVDSADEVGQAIIDSIEQIEIAEPVIVKVKFGEALKDQKIDMYLDDDYQFSFTTDERGTAELENLSDERYEWKAAELFVSGKIKPDNERGSASVKTGKDYGFVKMNTLWTEKKTPIVLWSTFAILAIVALPPLATGLIFRLRRRKSAE